MSTFLDAHADQLAAYNPDVAFEAEGYADALDTYIGTGVIDPNGPPPSRIRKDTVTDEILVDFDSVSWSGTAQEWLDD